jgi:hypothetical protein
VVNPNSPTTVGVHALEFGAGKPSLLPIEQLPVRPCNFGFWTLHGHTPPSQMAWASKLRVDDGYLRGSRRPLACTWPSDILGGLILGVVAVALSQWIRFPEWIWSFKELHRGLFYSLIMIGAYETATFFGDILGALGLFR